MLRTAVPKASINENDQTVTWKYEVWLACQREFAPPSGKTSRSEDGDEPKLRARAVARPNTRHIKRTSEFIMHIGHDFYYLWGEVSSMVRLRDLQG